MQRWIAVAAGLLAVFVLLGFVITWVPKQRSRAEQEACKNNLKVLSLFAAHHSQPKRGREVELPREIPSGTIVLAGVPADERLSWVVATLPGFNQAQQDTMAVAAAIDVKLPWSAAINQKAARIKLLGVICPGRPAFVEADVPAPTQYVGIAGLGVDAATLQFLPPGSADPNAGCFHYDSPTPFSAITDGLSQTLLFGERSDDLGPWLRGGPATLRGLDNRPGARPLIGDGGQFGGNHPFSANWAFADGSVRAITPQIEPRILYEMATIAGKGDAALPDE
ncbi:MAG TPA: DUF1559 domain-containing protein [Urbifossiella sp.]|nr:DUF1559 domain-containing protein [Urbifossiella sp.]